MDNKVICSPDKQRFNLYTSLINNGAKGADRTLCMTIIVSMLLAIVMYLEQHFPQDGRRMVQEWLQSYYARIDGTEETKQ